MHESCSDRLNETTTEPEVFQNMDDFELPKEYSSFGMSIRLQFPKFSRGFSVSDFKSFIEENVGGENVVALGRLSFPNEWQLQVSNKEIREKIIRIERTKINMRTCWISPLSESEVRGHIHWLPSGIPDDDVVNQLKVYGQVLFIERKTQMKFDLKFESDMRYFGLFLRSGRTMDDIPHFIYFNKFQAFVSIRGKAPICFHCHGVGHRKSECKAFHAKLGLYCAKTPGLGNRERPRGRRHKSIAQIGCQKLFGQGDNAGFKESVCIRDDKLEGHNANVTEPQLKGCVKDGGLPGRTGGLPNPSVQLRDLEMDIVETLSNTADVLNEKIEVAARFLCGELKSKKKRKRKQKKRSALPLPN